METQKSAEEIRNDIETCKNIVLNAENAIKKHYSSIGGSIVAGIILILCTPLHMLCPYLGALAFSSSCGEYCIIVSWKKIIKINTKVITRSNTLLKLYETRESRETNI